MMSPGLQGSRDHCLSRLRKSRVIGSSAVDLGRSCQISSPQRGAPPPNAVPVSALAAAPSLKPVSNMQNPMESRLFGEHGWFSFDIRLVREFPSYVEKAPTLVRSIKYDAGCSAQRILLRLLRFSSNNSRIYEGD